MDIENTGILFNLSTGGESGSKGTTRSKEWRRNHSITMKGNNNPAFVDINPRYLYNITDNSSLRIDNYNRLTIIDKYNFKPDRLYQLLRGTKLFYREWICFDNIPTNNDITEKLNLIKCLRRERSIKAGKYPKNQNGNRNPAAKRIRLIDLDGNVYKCHGNFLQRCKEFNISQHFKSINGILKNPQGWIKKYE